MSERLPAPDFDSQNYARPNLDWVCGNACEGRACPLGPDSRGNCRATSECKPVLKTKPGETKGRWVCTRQGGECDSGPLPDGSCCRPIPKCSPVPTLRLWRGRITLAIIAASCAVLFILLGNPPWRNNFINSGPLSEPHSGTAFAALAVTNHLKQNCGACHVAGNSGPNGMVNAAVRAKPGILDLKGLALAMPATPTAIDESCLKCHTAKNFHQPNAPQISCSFCHVEHQGSKMVATTDASCGFCHADVDKMQVAAGRLNSSQELLTSAATIHHFAEDHPQFKFIAKKMRDPDTLKFNHALHLTGSTIPKLPGGEKLDCTFCHQPDAAGALMKPVVFEKSCRLCHALQFDPETPQLQLPHGSAEFVSAYLRSLPKQFLNLAREQNVPDENSFVQQKLAGLRAQFGNGEDLEKRIFFSTATSGPEANIGTLSGGTRAIFPGCAYCHEVKNSKDGPPQITKPIQAEHWLAQAKFEHSKHSGISCEKCHDAIHSKDTADILLPAKETCAECHSPRGGVANACAECHSYHKPLPAR